METRQIKPGTVILLALLLVGLIAVGIQLPALNREKQLLQTEAAATPTPTADVRSMMLVTLEPGTTPRPTELLLKPGVAGDDVTKLQQRLSELGYYTGEVDGAYGPGTQAAVLLFQTQHGLDADGIAGDRTRSMLYSQNAQPCAATPAPTQTPSALSRGAEGDPVVEMQQRLKELGFYDGECDGDYGPGTQSAVRLFQSQHGLTVDGAAGEKTLGMLYSEDAQPMIPPPTFNPDAPPLLVNRTHTLPEDYHPADLVLLRNTLPEDVVHVKGSEIEGDRTAAAALEAMFRAAVADGVGDWQISAGYRSIVYQKKLFDNKVAEYRQQGMSGDKARSATRNTVADPGTSEHHTGLAFDITTPGKSFAGTPQQKWLHEHCWEYGFIIRYQEGKEDITGFVAECWHIRFVGTVHSLPMRDKGQCLEEYLGETE
ncbi:MAG: peptidoglycan-binding protein [Clostridia bacterium]|nr:peptidoglycan-binding protein [Clostridia bacterium]